MEKVIWKYTIDKERQDLFIPEGSEVIYVHGQHGYVRIWVLCDPKAPVTKRTFEVFGTGIPIKYDIGTSRKYIGSVMLFTDSLVFHVFEYTGI